MSSITQVLSQVIKDYRNDIEANPKLQMVDGLIVFSVASALVQLIYVVLVGSFPFNSFLSGFLCHIGLFALSVSLRFQLCNAKEFQDITPEKAYGDFALCCLILFFVVFSFMG